VFVFVSRPSAKDNDYMQDEHDIAGDVEGGHFSPVHHVESYAARPTKGKTYCGRGMNDIREIEYSSEEYCALATKWGAESVGTESEAPRSLVKLQQLLAMIPQGMPGRDRFEELIVEATADPRALVSLVSHMGMGGYVRLPGGSAGGAFPYNFDLRGEKKIVQLIVGKPGKTDARELLESFDSRSASAPSTGATSACPPPPTPSRAAPRARPRAARSCATSSPARGS
jgi:hypothetical protein